MKREPALRWLPATCALALVVAAILAPVLAIPIDVGSPPVMAVPVDAGGPAELGRGGEPTVRMGGRVARLPAANAYGIALMIALQSVVVALARFLPIRIRVREFERALPIRTRDAVLARMATTWLSLFAPLCVATAVFAAFPVEGLWQVPVYGALALASAVSVVFVYRPRRAALGVVETVAVVAAGLGVLVASAIAPMGAFSVAAAIIVGACLATISSRTGHGAAADDPRAEPARSTGAPADLGVRLFGPLRWTLLRSTALRPQSLVFFALAAIAPAAFAGGNRALLVWIAVLVAGTSLRLGLQSLHGLGGLPVSRERLLRYAAVPSLVVLVASVVASTMIPRPFTGIEPFSRGVAIDGASDDTLTDHDVYRDHVRVPPSFWRIGTRGDAVVTAPWGETAEVLAHPLWPGSDVVAYNPYDVDVMSSARFLEWQLSRALVAVHGDAPDPDAAAEAWVASGFSDDDEGPWAWRRGLPMKVSLPRLRDADSTEYGYALDPWRDAPRRAGFAALQVTLLWLVLCAFVLRPNVPDARGRQWRRALQSDGFGVVLLVALALAVVVYEAGDRALIQVLEASAGQWIDARIGGTPWAWAGLVLAVAASGYALLRWRIGRIEVPPLALNGWTKKPVAIF